MQSYKLKKKTTVQFQQIPSYWYKAEQQKKWEGIIIILIVVAGAAPCMKDWLTRKPQAGDL